MAYCTFEELTQDIPQDVLIQLCNDEERIPKSKTEDEEEVPGYDLTDNNDPIVIRINKAIEDADSEIDSFLDGNYDVPVNPIPKRINKISRTIAKYNLYNRRTLDLPEILLDQYKLAIKTLQGIQEGTITIGLKPESDELPIYRTNKTANDRVFSSNFLNGY